MNHISVRAFSDSLRKYLRAGGYFQKGLAKELGLHPKVLSRKLRGNGDSHLTGEEVQRIISILARWHAITTRDEAFELLELAKLEPGSFTDKEWETPPLSQLAGKDAMLDDVALHFIQHSLPAPLTSFVGREEEVGKLRELLGQDEVRLVTLVGAGGSGKTRLAQHVANDMADEFAQGVWFVALASVRDATQVPKSILQALDIQSTLALSAVQSLITYLRHKQLLLILDNFEQVREAAGVVGELLAAAPGLKVLVTSRVVLHLYGESEFNVSPLELPNSSAMLDIAKLEQYGAIQLFIERARAVMPDFSLTTENAAAIAQICARVDGLPLTLELAAARIKVLPPELLLARLSAARLTMLASEAWNLPIRQQALRKTIRWSYDLLSQTERIWFARLGVFNGGWSLEAAEALMQALAKAQGQDMEDMADAGSMLNLLGSLLDNSLLVRLPVTAGQARFTMLETLREYALERLKVQGEIERVRDSHACYYLGVAEEAEIGLKGAQQRVWHAQMVVKQDNFRAALEWSIHRASAGTNTKMRFAEAEIAAVEVALRLAAALRLFWEWQGYLVEGREWLEAALALPPGEDAGRTTLAARARALSEAARLLCLQNEQSRSVALAEESIALWRQLDDPTGLVSALFHRGWPAFAQGDYALAASLFEQGLQLLSPTGDVWMRAQLLFLLGAAAGFTYNFEQMHSYYDQCKVLFEQVGDRAATADVLKDEGGMAVLEGKYSQAIANLLKSLELSRELGYKQFIGTGMGLLGFAVGMKGEPDGVSASLQAAQLWGAAHGLLGSIGSNPWLSNVPAVQVAYMHIRSRVDDASWRDAWHTGRTLTEEQAIAAFLVSQGL